MQKPPRYKRSQWMLWVALGGLTILFLYGCQETSSPTSKATTAPSASAAPTRKGGAQLWSETCARCHNLRPPTEFSNGEWSAIVHHMRVRADLTGEQQREILTFIQSANAQ